MHIKFNVRCRDGTGWHFLSPACLMPGVVLWSQTTNLRRSSTAIAAIVQA